MVVSLIKKIFLRKDLIKIIKSHSLESDEKELNSFFKEVCKERGKIISIKPINEISSKNYYEETGRNALQTFTDNYYLIHYKCSKEIENSEKLGLRKP